MIKSMITFSALRRSINLPLQGIPFRDAYKEVGRQIAEGEFEPSKTVEHTHEGSIGNLCLDEISQKKEEILKGFNFVTVNSCHYKINFHSHVIHQLAHTIFSRKL
jgi:argininosuccinate lyase